MVHEIIIIRAARIAARFYARDHGGGTTARNSVGDDILFLAERLVIDFARISAEARIIRCYHALEIDVPIYHGNLSRAKLPRVSFIPDR